ncbi:GTPase-activating protein, partial [Ascosphaera aggregata]
MDTQQHQQSHPQLHQITLSDSPSLQQKSPLTLNANDPNLSSPVVSGSGTRSLTDERRLSVISASIMMDGNENEQDEKKEEKKKEEEEEEGKKNDDDDTHQVNDDLDEHRDAAANGTNHHHHHHHSDDDDEDDDERNFETGDEGEEENDNSQAARNPQIQLEIPYSKSIVDSLTSKDTASLDIPSSVVSPLLSTHTLSTEGMENVNLSKEEDDPVNDYDGDDQDERDNHKLDDNSLPLPNGPSPPPVPPPRNYPAPSTLPPRNPASTTDDSVSQQQQQQQQQQQEQEQQLQQQLEQQQPFSGETAAKEYPPLPPRDHSAQTSSPSESPSSPPPSRPAPPIRTPTVVAPPKTTAPPPRRGGPIGWLQRVASREFNKPSSTSTSLNTDSSSTNDSTRRTADVAASGSSKFPPHHSDFIATTDDIRRLSRSTLKDRFQALRMREEGIPPLPPVPGPSQHGDDSAAAAAAGAPATATADLSHCTDAGNARVRSESLVSATLSVTSLGSGSKSESRTRRPSLSGSKDNGLPPLSSILNPNLPPGTVSGISKSAADASAPVNWELWQQVVNNGPLALKGANAEAFNAAIKAGIPQTIRGVIWQVLADSRNPELEELYKELLARGTQNEYSRATSFSFSGIVNGNGNGNGNVDGNAASASHPPSINEKPERSERSSTDKIDSSNQNFASNSAQSSIHSETSTPTNGSAISHISPSFSQEKSNSTADTVTLASADSAPKKMTKEETASLQKLEKAIKRDLGSRTSYSKYFMSQKNQDGLFGVCKAYALYDEAVGYAQGMNFIVMPLLFNMEEGEAFTLMVKLMNKYGMREMFIQGMPGLHLRLYQFERLLEDLHPALACHLKRRGVTPILYATQWFLTLFAYRFPLQLVLRIYDLIFEEGVESTILRFSVAIMMRNANTLLGMNDMSSLTTFLKEKVFDVYIDKQPSATSILESGFFGSSNGQDKEVYRANLMVQDACDIHLTPEMIKTYTREWEETTSTQQAAAAELEHLKKTVTSQAAKIRHLEEQSERSDAEHVQLVSEIVKLKVENEELMDMNEMMSVQ